jgi:PPE-repeat protein
MRATVGVRAKTPTSETAAAPAAAVSARERARGRRRRQAVQRGHGDEFMDMNIEVDPNWGTPPTEPPVAPVAASGQGAGPLGFADTLGKQGAEQASGLTTLSADQFGGAPTTPMMPGTWAPDGQPEGSGSG